MKRPLLFLGFITFSLLAHAQRNCGTMDYLRFMRQQDPALDARHAAYETEISRWIADHRATSHISFPVLPGFNPSGDPARDREAYAKAKAALYADPEAYRLWKSSPSTTQVKKSPRPTRFKEVNNQ